MSRNPSTVVFPLDSQDATANRVRTAQAWATIIIATHTDGERNDVDVKSTLRRPASPNVRAVHDTGRTHVMIQSSVSRRTLLKVSSGALAGLSFLRIAGPASAFQDSGGE